LSGWFYKRELRGGTKKDPSLTARYVKAYEKELVRLIRQTEQDVRDAVLKSIYPKELQEYTIDMTAFKQRLSQIINVRFREPARIEGNTVIRGQVARGTMRADQFLKLGGIQAEIGTMPIDNRVQTILLERNLTEIMGIGDDMEKRIVEQVSAGIMAGEGARDISGRLTDVFDGEESRAMRVARTETMTAFNQASLERYKKFGVDEVRWRVGGANICDHAKGFDGVDYPGGCIGLEGEIFSIGSAPPCPLHPNCKCILQPVIERVEVE